MTEYYGAGAALKAGKRPKTVLVMDEVFAKYAELFLRIAGKKRSYERKKRRHGEGKEKDWGMKGGKINVEGDKIELERPS